jgi:hypothetical protein
MRHHHIGESAFQRPEHSLTLDTTLCRLLRSNDPKVLLHYHSAGFNHFQLLHGLSEESCCAKRAEDGVGVKCQSELFLTDSQIQVQEHCKWKSPLEYAYSQGRGTDQRRECLTA